MTDKITSLSSRNSIHLLKMDSGNGETAQYEASSPFFEMLSFYAAFSFSGVFPLHLLDHILFELSIQQSPLFYIIFC